MFEFIFPNQQFVWYVLICVVIARYLMTTYGGFKNDFNEGDNFESKSLDAVGFTFIYLLLVAFIMLPVGIIIAIIRAILNLSS